MCELTRRLLALASLALLMAGPALSLIDVAHADERHYCCRRGRCCCAPKTTPTAGPCLRVACGCERGEGPMAPTSPVRVAAILPTPVTFDPVREEDAAPVMRDGRASSPAADPPEHPPRRLAS